MGTPATGRSARLRSEMTSRRQGFSPPQRSSGRGLPVARATSRSASAAASVSLSSGVSGWADGASSQVAKRAGVPALGGGGTGDDGHVHGDAALAEVGPEGAVLVGPAPQFAVGLPAGIGVDEAGGSVVGGDRQSEGEEAPRAPVRGAVEAAREPGEAEAAVPEVEHLLRLGGEPREGGLSKDVLEGEKAAEQNGVLRRPCGGGPVRCRGRGRGRVRGRGSSGGRPRFPVGDARAREAGLDEAVDEGVGGLRGAAVMLGELSARGRRRNGRQTRVSQAAW